LKALTVSADTTWLDRLFQNPDGYYPVSKVIIFLSHNDSDAKPIYIYYL